MENYRVIILLLCAMQSLALSMDQVDWLNSSTSIVTGNRFVEKADRNIRAAIQESIRKNNPEIFTSAIDAQVGIYIVTVKDLFQAYKDVYGSVEAVITRVVNKAGSDRPQTYIDLYRQSLERYSDIAPGETAAKRVRSQQHAGNYSSNSRDSSPLLRSKAGTDYPQTSQTSYSPINKNQTGVQSTSGSGQSATTKQAHVNQPTQTSASSSTFSPQARTIFIALGVTAAAAYATRLIYYWLYQKNDEPTEQEKETPWYLQ